MNDYRAPLRQSRDAVKVALTHSPRLYEAMRRPYAVARFLARRPHDPDYRVFALFGHKQGAFLDVGANAGMSALSFRVFNRRALIVSIEPNPFHSRDLRFVKKLARPMSFEICGASNASGEVVLYVPIYRGVPLTTEASLYREEVADSVSLRERLGSRMGSAAFEIEAFRVVVRPLDELGVDAAFIKLDVQGSELAALEGLSTTISRSRPVLLVETPDVQTRALLDVWNYVPHGYDRAQHRLVAELPGATNTVFVAH